MYVQVVPELMPVCTYFLEVRPDKQHMHVRVFFCCSVCYHQYASSLMGWILMQLVLCQLYTKSLVGALWAVQGISTNILDCGCELLLGAAPVPVPLAQR
jgi:hypothetical protein